MKQINVNNLSENLMGKFGLNLRAYLLSNTIEIRPTDIEYGVGFIIRIKLEWSRLSAEFIPDNFSASLLQTMGASDPHKKELFKLLAEICTLNYEMFLNVNGEEVDPVEPTLWNQSWKKAYFKLSKKPIIIDDSDILHLESAILDISESLLGLVLALLPLEEALVLVEDSSIGLPEGALVRVEVNRYERSQINRQICLKIHGCICSACNFKFENMYGNLGKGFIHVHHIVPVSQLGPDYKINPEKDLIPLCPNCHAMIHTRNPPYSLEELKNIISLNMKY